MAYFFDPNSYANTLYGAPPFMRRRPSPPPMTFYPREAADPYVRALAEEQAARTALQDAIKREREARQRRAEEESKAKLRERARQRPQTMYGGYCPNPYGYPGFGYGQSYDPDNDYGYCRGDEDMEYEYPQYSPFFAPPRREAVKRQFQSVPRTARSQSRWPTQKERTPSPKPPSPDLGPKVSIPISSPSPKPSKPLKPEASPEEQNGAASKIQSAYRVHHALNSIKSAREKFDSLVSFTTPASLEFDLSSPPQGDERPKLTYSKTNAPVHVHEDSLIKLLQTLDAVESHGDRTVREKRRELVKEIEKELERIDAEIRRQYESVLLRTIPPSDMEVEAESRPSDEDISTSPSKEVKMDEDVKDKSVNDSAPAAAPVTTGAADVISSQPELEPTVPAQPVAPESSMEIEPSDQPIQVPLATPEVPIADEDPRTTTAPNDSSPESDAEVEMELKTPQSPNVTLPISQPIIQSADLPLPGQVGVQEIHPELRDASESVENTKVQVHESVEMPAQKSPSRRQVTIEVEEEVAEKDYVVL